MAGGGTNSSDRALVNSIMWSWVFGLVGTYIRIPAVESPK